MDPFKEVVPSPRIRELKGDAGEAESSPAGEKKFEAPKWVGNSLANGTSNASQGLTQADSLRKLGSYYKHQQDLLRGFERDPKKLEEDLKSIQVWIDEVQALLSSLE
jgi:hypothetical protein